MMLEAAEHSTARESVPGEIWAARFATAPVGTAG
jgi:hypothetical protein